MINLCARWRGYEEQYAQLGIVQRRFPRISVDPSEVVDQIRRQVMRPASSDDRSTKHTIFLHCEGGDHAGAGMPF